jgi:two-component system nitrate/nitrite response regulator NarL
MQLHAEMEPVTVVLADDHPVFRDGLQRLLELAPGIVVLAAVDDGRAALEAIRSRRPQVAIIDLQLPDIDGSAVIDMVRRERLPTRLLVLSAQTDSAVVYRCIELGAAGYLPKLTAGDDICAAVLALARGETVVSSGLQSGLASEIRIRRADDRPVLTPRELDIVRLAADGHSNAEIALRLHVSTATVKTHLQHIFEKLEVSDRSAAVAQALRRGLLA